VSLTRLKTTAHEFVGIDHFAIVVSDPKMDVFESVARPLASCPDMADKLSSLNRQVSPPDPFLDHQVRRTASSWIALLINGLHQTSGPSMTLRQCRARDRYFPRDGYTTMKFDWLGIFTFGNVWAFISSFSPMIPLRWSR